MKRPPPARPPGRPIFRLPERSYEAVSWPAFGNVELAAHAALGRSQFGS